jgi:hypothetical protein
MLSKKNKNQNLSLSQNQNENLIQNLSQNAFEYEEEFNQSNDSLEKNKHPKFIIGNEELLLDQEKSKLLLNLIMNVYTSETQVKKFNIKIILYSY